VLTVAKDVLVDKYVIAPVPLPPVAIYVNELSDIFLVTKLSIISEKVSAS